MIGLKLKKNPITYKWKNYYEKKVWTVNASNVIWVECQHINKTVAIVQLEAQIQQARCKLDKLQKKKQTNICRYQNTQISIIGNGHASTRIGISTRTGTCPYWNWDSYLEVRHHLPFVLF
jgi:hypothetical protein